MTENKPAENPPVPGSRLTKRQFYQQLIDQLSSKRQRHLTDWRDIDRVLFPGRYRLADGGSTGRGKKAGLSGHRAIIDSTGTLAARTLASGMMSGLTSRARSWFRLATPDPELAVLASVKRWLADVTDILESVLLKSNFYNVMPTYYGDLGGFGTATMIMEEDEDEVVRFRVFEVGSYSIGIDAYGRVRVFAREFHFTTRQLVEKFGFEQCSGAVKSAWKKGQTEVMFPVAHTIMPNPERDPNRLSSKFKPFASAYFELQAPSDQFLSERGYDEFPVLSTRWATIANSAYGSEWPGLMALGDINQLQFGEKMAMQALEKLVKPPMVGPASMMSIKASILSGDLTVDDGAADSKNGFRPVFQVKPELGALREYQAEVRARIKEVFFAPTFQMLSSMDNAPRQKTAFEVAAMQEEKLTILGPVVEQMDEDCLRPMINRLFQTALRRGILPAPPEELRGRDLKVDFMSIMHAAQKSGNLTQLERVGAMVTKLATEAQDPNILDTIDMDELVDEYVDGSGVSPKILRSKEEVQARRKTRADKAATMQRAQMLEQVGKGAKNLSEADTSGKNALTDTIADASGNEQEAAA